MRSIILATALLALAPAAIAQQSYPAGPAGPPGPPPNSTVTGLHQDDSTVPSQVSAPDPNNCGTPDEPKNCPPMPRRALNYYPPNR